MNLSETILALLKGQVATLTLGIGQEGKVWGVCQHIVSTSPESTMEITHKAESPSVLETVTKIVKQYNDAESHRQMVVPATRKKLITP